MWTKDQNDNLAHIDLPAEVHAKELGLEPANLLSLAIDGGYVKAAVSRWGETVAALVDDPDLLELPLDDPLSCIAIGFMRHLAIQCVK